MWTGFFCKIACEMAKSICSQAVLRLRMVMAAQVTSLKHLRARSMHMPDHTAAGSDAVQSQLHSAGTELIGRDPLTHRSSCEKSTSPMV